MDPDTPQNNEHTPAQKEGINLKHLCFFSPNRMQGKLQDLSAYWSEHRKGFCVVFCYISFCFLDQ